jgi:hypothetical protein
MRVSIERYTEDFSRQLLVSAQAVRQSLRGVVTASDYARVVGTLQRELLATDAQRRVWIDGFGLSYCAFAIPSLFFPVPIKVLFPTEGDLEMGTSNESVMRTESGYGQSFFKPRSLGFKSVHVHFIHNDIALKAIATKNLRRSRVLLVSDDYLEALKHSSETKTANSSCILFITHNRDAFRDTFGFIPSVDSLWGPPKSAELMELASIKKLSRSHTDYACVVLPPNLDSQGLVF